VVPFYLLFLGGILINLFAFFNFAVDIRRGGPMVEYERRIASGELVDGDSFQVLFWSLTKGSFLG